MANTVRFGALVPTWYIDAPPSGNQISEYCHAAEELGFESVWAIDRLFGPYPVLEPYTVLTWAAAATRKVRIGSTVILATLRQPVWLAKEVATLDYLSGGRVDLGISLGGSEQAYTSVGVPMKQRAGRLNEAVMLMRKLWAEDNVTWQGKYYQVKEATILPKPAQKHVPILLGANADAGVARAGRIADGWIASAFTSVDNARQRWPKVLAAAREAGRDPSMLEFGKLLYLWVDDNAERAKQTALSFYQAQYPTLKIAEQMACGSPEQCAQFIQPFLDAGVTRMILGPTGLEIKQLELLANRVIPKLRVSG